MVLFRGCFLEAGFIARSDEAPGMEGVTCCYRYLPPGRGQDGCFQFFSGENIYHPAITGFLLCANFITRPAAAGRAYKYIRPTAFRLTGKYKIFGVGIFSI